MLEDAYQPSLVNLSVKIYRLLVRTYPDEFRQEYGSHMTQVFRDCCRQVYRQGGVAALIALWARTALDYCKTIIDEYARGGVHVTRDKFHKPSGWALILGSFSITIGWLAGSRPPYSEYNAASLPVDRYANMAGAPLMVVGLLLVSLGMLGMLSRYGRKAGGFGSLCLGFGAACGLISSIGIVGLGAKDSNPWWSMFFFGWTFQYLALVLFGIVCLQRKVLPRWNWLPILSSIWLPAFVTATILIEIVTGSDWVEVPQAIFAVLFLSGLIGMLGLGYLLSSDVQPAAPTAGAV